MPFTVPEKPEPMSRSFLPPGGAPADDAAYIAWRDGLLAAWSERLVLRFWHSATFEDLMPAWEFDRLLLGRLGGELPLFRLTDRLHYTHRLRFLAVALKTRRKVVQRIADQILTEVVG